MVGIGLLLFALIRFLTGRLGGSDTFVEDLRTITQSVIGVPLRNFLIVTLLGAFLAVTGITAGLLTRREDDWLEEEEDGNAGFDQQAVRYSDELEA